MKKILAILGMITCMVGLCACGQEDSVNLPVSADELVANCESTIKTMDMIVGLGDAAIEQNAVDPVIYNGLLSWRDSLGDIGEFIGTNGGTVSVKGDEVVVEVNIQGTKHDAVVEFIIDGSITNFLGITTNVEYSFGEIMSKAVMNTVIGMGTVFVVLIFISLIISCFGLFGKAKPNKKEETPQSKAASDPVVAQIAEKEELADDTELVAVIAAAIAAYEGSGSTDGFVVRSIRKSNKSKWQNA